MDWYLSGWSIPRRKHEWLLLSQPIPTLTRLGILLGYEHTPWPTRIGAPVCPLVLRHRQLLRLVCAPYLAASNTGEAWQQGCKRSRSGFLRTPCIRGPAAISVSHPDAATLRTHGGVHIRVVAIGLLTTMGPGWSSCLPSRAALIITCQLSTGGSEKYANIGPAFTSRFHVKQTIVFSATLARLGSLSDPEATSESQRTRQRADQGRLRRTEGFATPCGREDRLDQYD